MLLNNIPWIYLLLNSILLLFQCWTECFVSVCTDIRKTCQFGKLSMDYEIRNYSELSYLSSNVQRPPKWVILTDARLLQTICAVSSSNWKHFQTSVWNSLFRLLLSPSGCHFWWVSVFLQKNILQNIPAYLCLPISWEGAEIQIWACFT